MSFVFRGVGFFFPQLIIVLLHLLYILLMFSLHRKLTRIRSGLILLYCLYLTTVNSQTLARSGMVYIY